MAHFAWLDSNNVVYRVSVVDNERLLDNEGQESEAIGIAYLTSVHGEGRVWKQTSYNTYRDASGVSHHAGDKPPFRGQYAGLGSVYDEELDEFVTPPPQNNFEE